MPSEVAMRSVWLLQVATGDCPHTLFYGAPGAGKKTLIIALLRQIFGPGVERLKVCIGALILPLTL